VAAVGTATFVGWFGAGLAAGTVVGAAVTVAVVQPKTPVEALVSRPMPSVSAPLRAPPLRSEPARAPDVAPGPALPNSTPEPVEPRRPASTAAPSLELETRAFGDVQRALREGRPGDALRLLAEQEHAFARGALHEERAAARVLALCAAGRIAEARSARERFLASYPQSPAAERVRASCAP
jgi:hypothetical protein